MVLQRVTVRNSWDRLKIMAALLLLRDLPTAKPMIQNDCGHNEAHKNLIVLLALFVF